MELHLLLLLVSLIGPPLLLWLFLQHKYKQNETTLLPPGPPRIPILGNLHQLHFANLYSHLYRLSTRYGPLMSLRLGSLTAIVVSSAAIAKEALSTHDRDLAGRHRFYGQMKISYDGLNVAFGQYGEYWREIRKIMVIHLLSIKRVQSFRHVRYDEVSRAIDIISQLASQSKPVNLSEIIISLITSIICRMAFGKTYQDEYSGVMTKSKFHDLLHETQALMASFFMQDYFPYMGWIDKLLGKTKWADKVCKDLDLFLQEIIDDHLVERKKGDRDYERQENIIDVLLQLQEDDSLPVHLTMDHIKCHLMDIFVAGTNTNSASLVWAMTELIKNPNAMKKVQEEVRSIIHENRRREFCSILEDDLDKLIYLKAVVKETLRLHPPAPLPVPHLATKTCKIKGYEIKKGSIVYLNLWAIGRDPLYWENPNEFCPERFLGSAKDIDFKGKDFGFIPFGAGRRGCPGMNLGIVLVELVLANLVYKFKWELPQGTAKEDMDFDVRPGLTMHKKNDLILRATVY